MNKSAPTIETKRLILRQLSVDDTADLYRNFADAEVMKYWQTRDKTALETRARIEAMIAGWQLHGFGDWAVVDKSTSEMIGYCGLHYITDRPEVNLGYLLARSSWGKGYATETSLLAVRYGFEQVGLRQIIGVTAPDNLASIKVLVKCGMSHWQDIVRFGQPRVVYSVGEKS